jgi:hypothetical protein
MLEKQISMLEAVLKGKVLQGGTCLLVKLYATASPTCCFSVG